MKVKTKGSDINNFLQQYKQSYIYLSNKLNTNNIVEFTFQTTKSKSLVTICIEEFNTSPLLLELSVVSCSHQRCLL